MDKIIKLGDTIINTRHFVGAVMEKDAANNLTTTLYFNTGQSVVVRGEATQQAFINQFDLSDSVPSQGTIDTTSAIGMKTS